MARPLKEIDRTEFEKLCGLQCTKEEICGWFEVTDKTLESWCRREYKEGFSDVFRKKRGTGKIALRRASFRLAEKNAAMNIFLCKNFLGMTDEPSPVSDDGKTEPDDVLTAALKETAEMLEAGDADAAE